MMRDMLREGRRVGELGCRQGTALSHSIKKERLSFLSRSQPNPTKPNHETERLPGTYFSHTPGAPPANTDGEHRVFNGGTVQSPHSVDLLMHFDVGIKQPRSEVIWPELDVEPANPLGLQKTALATAAYAPPASQGIRPAARESRAGR